jgi:tetratricopeptide (TPR) repeat protein
MNNRTAPSDTALREIENLAVRGEVAEALARLRAVEPGAGAPQLQRIAQLFTRLNLHAEAERCHRRAVEIAPQNPQYLYNLATSVIALGKLEEAEHLLDAVIARAPQDYDAYYNRATLRKQTPERNHVAQIETLLSRPDPAAQVQLGYALAKELEDLGEYGRAFSELKRGADARRRMLSYRVDDDVLAIDKIAAAFGPEFFARPIEGARGHKPIFILGLPRSGTTLIDRILSSHANVESLGEIGDFAAALMRAVPTARNKFDLIAQSANADFASVGNAYANTTRAIATGAARAIDKTPLNFLYLGLIARALPDATIVHVRRGAMDVCYAMYKTLFRMAYPFSYDLGDLARYYLSYRKLMAHWRAMLPDGFIEISYEDVIREQEESTRGLVAKCRLTWDDACLAPERNEKPSLTASAAQIRRKVYDSSIGLWCAYEQELQPLVHMLSEAGVDIE